MGRISQAIVRTVLVLGVGAAGAALGVIAVRAPTTDVGLNGSSSVTIWPNVDAAPVWLDMTLQESGRVDFQVDSEFPSPPGIGEDGRWTAVGPFQQATEDGPPVTAIADVIYLQIGCGSAFDPHSLVLGEAMPESTVTFTSDPCTRARSGNDYQLLTIALVQVSPTSFRTDSVGKRSYGSGANFASFSLRPRAHWTASSLSTRISRLPGLYYGQQIDGFSPPDGAASAGAFSHLSATIAGNSADLVDTVIPEDNAKGTADSQSERWETRWDPGLSVFQDPLYPALVQWKDPVGESWAQGILLAAGVLIGVASSLAIEFLVAKNEGTAKQAFRLKPVRRGHKPLI